MPASGPRSRGASVHPRPCQGHQPWPRTSAAPGLVLATQKLDGITGRGTTASLRELQREVEDLRALPEDEPEVEAGRDLADLVADPLGHERGLRVVEDDRLLAVEPALLLVDLRPDRLQPEGEDLVAELALLAVEHLALPRQEVDEVRRGSGEPRP